MSEHLSCPRGHKWKLSDGDSVASGGAPPVCPICGSAVATGATASVVDQYQTSSHTPEALERLVESYLALGLPDEARRNAAVLGKNYPGTYWYRQSLRLIRKHYPGATAAPAQAAAAPSTGQ